MAKTKIRQGHMTVTVDDTALIASLDKVTGGALTRFLDAAEREFNEVKAAALPLWPVRTGDSKEDLRVTRRMRPDKAEVWIWNDYDYTYKIKWSVRTAKSLEKEIADESSSLWATMEPYLGRIETEKDRRRVAHFLLRPTTSKHEGRDISGGVLRGWSDKMGTPELAALQRSIARKLLRRHGQGAPNDRLAGRHVWTTLIRNPLKKRRPAFLELVRDDVNRLAGAT